VELITGENDKGRRLDRILRKALPDHPLPLIHRLLRQKQVLVNGTPAKAQYRLGSGDIINIHCLKNTKKTAVLSESKIYPQIIFKNSEFLAVNKPAGISVHGPESLDTIVQSLLAGMIQPSLSFKPGPMHRLDRMSSGIVVFSVSLEGAHLFSLLLREQKIKKTYLTIVDGIVEKEELWKDYLFRDCEKKKTFVSQVNSQNSKIAITKIKPLFSSGSYSLIIAEIVTGRTHQIRAQAAFHGHPLTGDIKYGSKSNAKKSDFFLHAWKLEFLDYSFKAPLPLSFNKKIKELFKDLDMDTYCIPD